MRSSRPSASVRSSLPFSNARRVNSPGSAGTHIFERRRARANSAASTGAPTMDVKFGDVLAGRAGRIRETTAPPHRRSAAGWHRAAAAASPFAAAAFCRPARSAPVRPAARDTRTMAIALGGRPDDSAKMVWSRGCIAYLFRSALKGNAISIGGELAPRLSRPQYGPTCCSRIPQQLPMLHADTARSLTAVRRLHDNSIYIQSLSG